MANLPAPYDEVVAAEAVNEIANALLFATGQVVKSHGETDPNIVPIMVSGFLVAIKRMERIDPNIGKLIRAMLNEGNQEMRDYPPTGQQVAQNQNYQNQNYQNQGEPAVPLLEVMHKLLVNLRARASANVDKTKSIAGRLFGTGPEPQQHPSDRPREVPNGKMAELDEVLRELDEVLERQCTALNALERLA